MERGGRGSQGKQVKRQDEGHGRSRAKRRNRGEGWRGEAAPNEMREGSVERVRRRVSQSR